MATPHQTIDRVGGWLSLVCAIHCAVVPIAVLLAALGVPVFGSLGVFDDPRFELGFSAAAVILAVISVGLGVRAGANHRPMLIGFAVGLTLILGSHVAPGPKWLSHLILVVGALTVARTHHRSRHSCADHQPGHAASAADGHHAVGPSPERPGDDPAAPASAPLLP
jgi:hypothetical protein